MHSLRALASPSGQFGLNVFFILLPRPNSLHFLEKGGKGDLEGQRLEVTQQIAFPEQASEHEQAPGFAGPFSSFLATRYKLIYLVRKTWFIAI